MTKKIIDISYHNKNIDFAQLAKEASFVIIRVQYGSRKIDSKYLEYIDGCEKYGIPYGFYAYGCFVSVADAVVEATDFYNRTKTYKGKVWVLDTEDDTLDSCGPEKLAEASQVFIDTLKKLGIERVGFYVSHHMYNKYGLDKVKADFKWIPRYGKNDGQPHDKPEYACDIWQYTDKGRIAGISTFVDLNVLNGDKPLEWFTGTSSEQVAPVGTGDIQYVYTGGFAGPALSEVHNYLFKTGHNFDAKRGSDGSIVFLIGPFDTGMKNYADCKGFLDSKRHGYTLMKPEIAIDWRKK